MTQTMKFAILVRDFFTDDSAGHAKYLREQAVNAIAAEEAENTAAPDLLTTLEWVLLHIEHRPGLAHRMDLFSEDERAHIRAAIAAAK